MRATIDRIEGSLAVLILADGGNHRFTLPVSNLPPGAHEGDVLILTLERDAVATRAARECSSTLIAKLREK